MTSLVKIISSHYHQATGVWWLFIAALCQRMGFYLTTSLSVAGIFAVQNSLVLYDIHTLPCLRGKVVANLWDLSLCATEVAFSTPFASLPRLSCL